MRLRLGLELELIGPIHVDIATRELGQNFVRVRLSIRIASCIKVRVRALIRVRQTHVMSVEYLQGSGSGLYLHCCVSFEKFKEGDKSGPAQG